MAELVAMCVDLGLDGASSYLQSGNLLVDTDLDAAPLEALMEQAMRSRFGYSDIDVLARSAKDLQDAIGAVPDGWKAHQTSALHFTFLKQGVKDGDAAGGAQPPDEYAIGRRVVYVHCPNGYGRTKLDNGFFERLCQTRATTRNWNTTVKLQALAAGRKE